MKIRRWDRLQLARMLAADNNHSTGDARGKAGSGIAGCGKDGNESERVQEKLASFSNRWFYLGRELNWLYHLNHIYCLISCFCAIICLIITCRRLKGWWVEKYSLTFKILLQQETETSILDNTRHGRWEYQAHAHKMYWHAITMDCILGVTRYIGKYS